jgi:hypothetical protein
MPTRSLRFRCIGGQGPPTVDVAAAAPAVRPGSELPVKPHQTPNPRAIGPDVRLRLGDRFADGGQVDAERLRAPLQRRRDRPAPRPGRARSPPLKGIEHRFETESGMLLIATGWIAGAHWGTEHRHVWAAIARPAPQVPRPAVHPSLGNGSGSSSGAQPPNYRSNPISCYNPATVLERAIRTRSIMPTQVEAPEHRFAEVEETPSYNQGQRRLCGVSFVQPCSGQQTCASGTTCAAPFRQAMASNASASCFSG